MLQPDNLYQATADKLFNYLRDIIFKPGQANLVPEELSEEFQNFAHGLKYYTYVVQETIALAKALASGNLHVPLPPPSNEIAAPLKMLHASLAHLTWQAQQVAEGDYQQRVQFMGDFSAAFNNMVIQLDERHKEARAERIRLERYVDLMLANCPDPVLLFDCDARLVSASNSFMDLAAVTSPGAINGTTLEELMGRFFTPESLAFIEYMFEVSLRQKRTLRTEQEFFLENEVHARLYQMQITPMLEEDGTPAGGMMLLHETTELVRARSEADRARRLAELSSQAKSDFLARMSHEMRTPLNAIIGMATIYGSSDEAAQKDHCVQTISFASTHLLSVISDVLDMAQIEANRFTLLFDAFDLSHLIRRIVREMTYRMEEYNHTFKVEVDPQLPRLVNSDEQRIYQILIHLLSNAVKFTPKGGLISLELTVLEQDLANNHCILQLAVQDNGIGIPKEQHSRLFTAFEQGSGGFSRKFGGTGLGLALVKLIAEKLGGSVELQSELEVGSLFTVRIPIQIIAMELEEEAAAPTSTLQESFAANSTGIFSDKHILLAEDNDINCEVIVALLEHTGVNIDVAPDGAAAVDLYIKSPEAYDLILMDIHMPNMDGYQATTLIRSSGLPNAKAIPIIAVTANVFREDVERCLAAGMNGHLGKPLDAELLIARLKEYF
ncbi:MAG: ATP-binding protein [Symbiobacteriaceae bacterium]|nr:ATP-binding protein [Symbiobacteriaceae bacterium]